MKGQKTKPEKDRKRVAIVRIRGKVHVREDIKDTMKHLNLNHINNCIIIDTRDQYRGMINKVNDYVAWGEIDTGTLKKLLAKRGMLIGDKKFDEKYLKEKTKYKSLKEFSEAFMKFDAELKEIPGFKSLFRLSPPRKGHERGGIKKPYAVGGALGYRGSKINELIGKMV